jgi:undecaprenyl-diphosphatase
LTIFESFVYGAIQGLSEFLPVSSSGHLALLPHIMKIQDPGVVFDLMMHLGTGLAVIIYFREEILRYIKTLNFKLLDFKLGGPDRWFVRNFIFATIVSVIFILILMPVSKLARDPYLIVFNLSFFGALLWLGDYLNRKRGNQLESPMTTQFQWKLAGLIGLAQAIAIFPGVSRSGITLTVALVLGMRRKEAGSFSFLLSLPIIFAGILKEIPDLMKTQDQSDVMVLLVGVLTSFVVGLLTVHFFMKLIKSIQLGWFAVYRWILAILMVWSLS